MKKSIQFISVLCLMLTMFISCSDDNSVEPEPENGKIVGEWQLLKKSTVTIENGETTEDGGTDFSAYDKMSVLTFTADKKIDFKVYDTNGDGELYLDYQTGTFVEEDNRILIKFTEQSEDEPSGFIIDSYKIENNNLTFNIVEGKEPFIIDTKFTAKRIK